MGDGEGSRSALVHFASCASLSQVSLLRSSSCDMLCTPFLGLRGSERYGADTAARVRDGAPGGGARADPTGIDTSGQRSDRPCDATAPDRTVSTESSFPRRGPRTGSAPPVITRGIIHFHRSSLRRRRGHAGQRLDRGPEASLPL